MSNVLSGIFGGMGGCAVIGQTMINVKASGAQSRISMICAGLFLFLLVVVFGGFVGTIPIAAPVAVRIAVAVAAPITPPATPLARRAALYEIADAPAVAHPPGVGIDR